MSATNTRNHRFWENFAPPVGDSPSNTLKLLVSLARLEPALPP